MEYKSLTPPAATGGTITTTATHRIHTFTSSETFTSYKSMNIEVLVVAGGGGGSQSGGGAGGLIYNSSFAVSPQSYPVTVGNGGAAGFHTADDGQNSVFSIITAIGGAGGVEGNAGNVNGKNGGSGSGASCNQTEASCSGTGGTGTSGQGNAGGSINGSRTSGGGGGAGAASAGAESNYASAGGIGISYNISGTATYYSGGGGGGARGGGGINSGGGAGGLGGGGSGGSGNPRVVPTAGSVNTGGGGGGDWGSTPGAGGSGIVIIRYSLTEDITSANIEAISMTVDPPSESPCRAGICTVGVSVTWKNTGGTSGSSDLSITVSGGTPTITPSAYSSISFAVNEEKTLTFTVLDMIAGTHSICPNPN